MAELKTLKDYVLMKGELYCRMLGGILSRCIRHEEAQRKLKEAHSRTCGFYGEINLYCRLQRVCFYWPKMGKDVDLIQTNVKPATWLQKGKRVVMCLPLRIGEAHSYNT